MAGGGFGERERCNGKTPIELGDDSSMSAVVTLSDSDSVGSSAAVRIRGDEKLKMPAIDLVSERLDRRVVDKSLAKLLDLFPNACPHTVAADLESQLMKTSPVTALVRISNRYLEQGVPMAQEAPQGEPEPDHPQVIEKPTDILARPTEHMVGTSNHGEQQVDGGPVVLPPANYELWTTYTLSKEFPRYPKSDLRRVLNENNWRFVPSYKAISSDYTAALAAEQNGQARGRGKRKLNVRPRDKPSEPCYMFERELQSIQNPSAEDAEQILGQLKRVLQDGTHVDACEDGTSADIECGCCCSDYRFEEMVQCAEGHLFCFTCLRRRIEESTFGGSRASNTLPCMDTSGCEESFPWSEVKRALPLDVLAKYEQRQAEDAVVQAKITGLVYCPFCNTPWEVDPELRVLECANARCKKASCVLCREPTHVPFRCEEIEKKSETSMRRSIEERMTKALLRVCSVCKAELLKSDGCNKVTCRCGKNMCYVCREPIAANYEHFCRHARSGPKMACTICKKCSLWEEEEEDEVVKAAREAAMMELAQGDPSLLKRTIGPKLDTGSKKKPRPPPIPAAPFRPPPPEYYRLAAQAMVHVAEQLM